MLKTVDATAGSLSNLHNSNQPTHQDFYVFKLLRHYNAKYNQGVLCLKISKTLQC